jgi:ketosteroid isomerase-like protein
MRPSARLAICVLAYLCAATLPASASAPPEAIAVLNVERAWVNASAHQDAKALAEILSENFVHVNFQGKVRHRQDELALVLEPKPYQQHTSEQTVDFAGDTAVVHGLNTITQGGRVVLRLRYTDVYVKSGNTWRALSAQETAISAK